MRQWPDRPYLRYRALTASDQRQFPIPRAANRASSAPSDVIMITKIEVSVMQKFDLELLEPFIIPTACLK
jgi:hypothetical protein